MNLKPAMKATSSLAAAGILIASSMAYADECGLANILARTEALAEKFGDACAPAPLLKTLAERGGKFSDVTN